LLIITIIIIQIYGVNTLQGKKTNKEVVAT
jgi:hypothetical protein